MKKALIISFSNIGSDPRIQRQIKILKNDFHLTVLGFGHPDTEDFDFIRLPHNKLIKNKIVDALLLKFRLFEKFYWSRDDIKDSIDFLKSLDFDLVVANEIETLPLAFELFGRDKIWFDAHEYSPLEFDDNFKWRFFFKAYKYYLCKKYLQQAALKTTVCKTIAEEYEKEFETRFYVLMNSSTYRDLRPVVLDKEDIKIVHHGAAIRSREIEKMIELVDYLDPRFSLSLMLVPHDKTYFEELKKIASNKRVRFLDTVPFEKIPDTLNSFDVGLYLLPPSNFNQMFALPNKIFEFIQARLCIFIGPSPEMARLVNEHSVGVVSETFNLKEAALKLNSLSSEDIWAAKVNSEKASSILSFEAESSRLLEIIREIIK